MEKINLRPVFFDTLEEKREQSMTIGELAKELKGHHQDRQVYLYDDHPLSCVKIMNMSGDYEGCAMFFSDAQLNRIKGGEDAKETDILSVGDVLQQLERFDLDETPLLHEGGEVREISAAIKMSGDYAGDIILYTAHRLRNLS